MFGKKFKLNVNRNENVFGGNGSQVIFLNFGGNELELRLVTHDSIKWVIGGLTEGRYHG